MDGADMPTLDLNEEFESKTATFWYGKRTTAEFGRERLASRR
jgi:hypothetical protein